MFVCICVCVLVCVRTASIREPSPVDLILNHICPVKKAAIKVEV